MSGRLASARRSFFVVASALILSACTTLSPQERADACSRTDWRTYGENDGKLGVPTSARTEAFEDCAEVGQPVNLASYQAGRAAGLAEYCTATNGFRVGYEGLRYYNVCPPALEADFRQGYERGRRERPAIALYPSVGIGIGSGGGVSGGIGIGIGSFSLGAGHYWHGRHRHGPRYWPGFYSGYGHHHPGYYTPAYWPGFWFPYH